MVNFIQHNPVWTSCASAHLLNNGQQLGEMAWPIIERNAQEIYDTILVLFQQTLDLRRERRRLGSAESYAFKELLVITFRIDHTELVVLIAQTFK